MGMIIIDKNSSEYMKKWAKKGAVGGTFIPKLKKDSEKKEPPPNDEG